MDPITLLWWVTGIYLLVLVVVLAIATISVAFYAVRIARTNRVASPRAFTMTIVSGYANCKYDV